MTPSLENLIVAIGRLYLALTSIALFYSYTAYTHMDRNNALQALVSLDKLLALRVVASEKNDAGTTLTQLTALKYYTHAANDAFAAWSDGQDPHQIELLSERGFDEKVIPNARLLTGVPMRLAVGASCAIAIVTGQPGSRFNFATFQVIGRTYWVGSEQTNLIRAIIYLTQCATAVLLRRKKRTAPPYSLQFTTSSVVCSISS